MTTIDADTLRRWLNDGRPVIVLDVRRADDRAEWAIPGSIHVDAYQALKAGDPAALSEVDLPVDTPVVTVCGLGHTSRIAAERLRALGYPSLSLEGGMRAWSLAWNEAEVPLTGTRARVIQVRRTGKGCLSYVVGSAGEAAAIDPSLDPEVYADIAGRNGWRITKVLDTHIHADHLSRSVPLARLTGAVVFLPDQRRVSYPFQALRDGDAVRIGDATLVALHTPGHSWESTCYLLDDRALFTEDTLFLAGVGRPDLEAAPEESRARAGALYGSLRRLLALPGDVDVLPGHTNQPVDFDHEPLHAPLGEVRTRVELLRVPEEEFARLLLERVPPTPPNHRLIVRHNETGSFPEGDPVELEAGANRCAVS